MTLPLQLRRLPEYRLSTVNGRTVWRVVDEAAAKRAQRRKRWGLFWWSLGIFGVLVTAMQEMGVLP